MYLSISNTPPQKFEKLAENDEMLTEQTKQLDLVGICQRNDELRVICGISPLYAIPKEYQSQKSVLKRFPYGLIWL